MYGCLLAAGFSNCRRNAPQDSMDSDSYQLSYTKSPHLVLSAADRHRQNTLSFSLQKRKQRHHKQASALLNIVPQVTAAHNLSSSLPHWWHG